MPDRPAPIIVERYVPSVDWWVLALVSFLLLTLLAAIPVLLGSDTTVSGKIIGTLALVAFILYVIDITFFSSYYLMPDELRVVSQLRRHAFPYEDMTEVRPGGVLGLISFGKRKRFALSGNLLVISFSDGQWKKITVSPRARERFEQSLLGRAKGVKSGRKRS